MSGKKHDELDQVISEIRGEEIPPATLEQSAERVWQRMEAANPAVPSTRAAGGCAAIRADLALLEQRELSSARRLIVEDHLRECASCRAYAAGALDPVSAAANWRIEPSAATARSNGARYGWAAAAILLIAAVGLVVGERYLAGPAGSRAQIESLSGHAYLITAMTENPLKTGDHIGQDQMIRTAADSHAVLRLLDGSRVEMNQRTEFSLSAGFRNTTIQLDQGDIIVEAHHRSAGRLYVLTPDCTISDRGTIFSIESGTKGSRVGVVEGTVSVAHDGESSVLHAGQSVATAGSVNTVPVSGQIAWSENRQQYMALLDEFSRLGHRLEQIPSPEPRYRSKILPVVPRNTVLYLSVPNLGNMFAEADQIFQDELSRSAVLRDWWARVTTAQQEALLELAIGEIKTASQYLGNEMVVASSQEDKDGPVLLAPIKNPGLADFLRQRVALIGRSSKPIMRVVDEKSLASMSPTERDLIALVRPDMLVVGSGAAVLRMNAALENGSSGFEDTDFGKEILGAYSKGAQVLFAADLETLAAYAQRETRAPRSHVAAPGGVEIARELGFGHVKYLIATHGDVSGQTENRAVLAFADQRSGVASWLAAPAPVGSLDFVSGDAEAVLSVVTKQPAKIFDDVIRMVQQHNQSNVDRELQQEEALIGVDLRNNLAGALGGELTLALDGPILPKPSWKLIAEVNEPSVLQQSIATLVRLVGQHAIVSGKPVVMLEQQSSEDRIFYKITFAQANGISEIDYTYADGYLVAGPSRAVVMNALSTYANGTSLEASGSFRALLPRDSYANFSALIYWNLGPLAQPLGAQFGSADQGALERLAANAKPAAICAYGGSDTIEVASTTNVLDLEPEAMSVLSLLGQGQRGTSRASQP
jgi:hypothetical protein